MRCLSAKDDQLRGDLQGAEAKIEGSRKPVMGRIKGVFSGDVVAKGHVYDIDAQVIRDNATLFQQPPAAGAA